MVLDNSCNVVDSGFFTVQLHYVVRYRLFLHVVFIQITDKNSQCHDVTKREGYLEV